MSKNPMENVILKSLRYQKKARNFATFMLPFAVATSAVFGSAINTVNAKTNDTQQVSESRSNDSVSSNEKGNHSTEKLAGETSTTVDDFLKQPAVESGENSDLQNSNDTQNANDTNASGVRVEKAIDVVEESRGSENKNSGKEITQVSQARTYHTTANLNLRKGPGTKYSIKVTIPRGKNVTYKGRKGNWYKVSYKGKTGYVSKTYLRSGSIKKVSNSLNGKSMYVSSTAYTANCSGCSGKTAIGINLRKDPYKKVIAVDPNVIPLRKMVYVEGYGLAIAGDTGGAIKGHKIDIFMPTKKKALNWGRRTIKVTIQH